MCQSLVGLHPLISVIEKRKLHFLQKLCTLDDSLITNRIFLVRLFSYMIDNDRIHCGFIPYIFGILFKYHLHNYLLDYLYEGKFPCKGQWKNIVNNAWDLVQSNDWTSRISSDSDFDRFKNIHNSVEIFNYLRYARSSGEIRNFYLILKLITDIPDDTHKLCVVCNREFTDVYVHACCNCTGAEMFRDI